MAMDVPLRLLNATFEAVGNATGKDNVESGASSPVMGMVTATASRLNEMVLTEDIVMGCALVVGLTIAVIGRKLPTLFGGNLMLAVLLGQLMKSAQEDNADISQWVFWPVIIMCLTFACMSGCMCAAREFLVSMLTGIVFAAVGLAATLAVALKAVPWALVVGILLFGLGITAGLNYHEKRWLHKALSASIGAFLATDGGFWFLRDRDMAAEFAEALVRSGRSAEDAQAAAQDVRFMIAVWLGLSVAMFLSRLLGSYCWERRNPAQEVGAKLGKKLGDLEHGAAM